MRSTCPTCETAYTIPDDRIGPKGRKVRCARCGEEWRVFADAPAAPAGREASRPEPAVATPARPAAAPDLFDAIDDIADLPPATPPAPPSDPVASAAEFDPFDAADVEPDPAQAPAAAMVSAESVAPDPADAASPPAPSAETGPAASAPAPDGKPVAARRPAHRRRFPHLRLPVLPPRVAAFGGPAVFLAACLVCVGLVVLRAQVVSRLPGLAGLYRAVGLEVNLRGIVIGPIETLRETEDGKPVLVVEGTLSNTTGEMRDVPALRFALRDGDARELYAWSIDPRATSIAAGDRLRFRTRLVAPPERAADLQVRFAERRNRQAGLP